MPQNNQKKAIRPKWRIKYGRFAIPIILIVMALGAVVYVAYDAITNETDSSAVSGESDSNSGLFEFKAKDAKIINLIIFKDALAQKSEFGTTMVTELYLGLLERSLKNNFDMPDGNQIQKFNYVVREDGVIAVAVWSRNTYYDRMYDTDKNLDRCAVDDAWSMGGDPNEPRPDSETTVMVNIYPETRIPFVSPCWVASPTGDRTGLLDGSSKHVVLAQGVKSPWNSIGTRWKDAMVRGAGEIVVDLRDGCSYTITDNSGTYRANNYTNLLQVALWFTEEFVDDNDLPIPPRYLKDNGKDLVPYIENPASRGKMECP